ncbi:uncharacterized protein LOC108671086 [Hyalella azteca]|uniref:Uncharacterized protein LOC108671086 n=1 Tax=Hyalella azteca TaxID=294128 RepID=A0A8B7NK75_HYAAZ|nr:uncharacterized protein LOC108671086 [Hyalella azteca]XP_047741307.1 uncharacterized protein LOC108671086 [Hyalella azteca]
MASSAAGTPAPSSASRYQKMETISDNVEGILDLCPKYASKILNIECSDKNPAETYMVYMERHRKPSVLSRAALKKMCGFSYKTFESATTADKMDMSALNALLNCIFKVKDDGRDFTELLNKVREITNVRNDVMHNLSSVNDPTKFGVIQTKLFDLIEEAKLFYPGSVSEINIMERELQLEINCGFSPGCSELAYHCHCVLAEGITITNKFFHDYAEEALNFDMGYVKRTEVFHPLEVMLQDERSNKLHFQDLFKSSNEEIVLVSGEAGAGKTTLLLNIILQFNAAPYLQGYEVLLYIECRDRTTKSLQQVARQHFGDNFCLKLGGEDKVLQALKQLHVLFLVDGFDEKNTISTAVLEELLKKTWHSNSRILFTTRPHTVEDLKKLIAQNHRKLSQYKISPLTELSEQLAFIARYEQVLFPAPTPSQAMQERFSKLDPQLRQLFTEPISLLHFCSIYKETPEKIDRWRSFNDVSRDTLQLQKTIVAAKLISIGAPNNDVLIDDLFMVFGKCSLEFLCCNKMTFTDAERVRLLRKCCDKINFYCQGVDAGVFLNVMLKVKRSLSGSAGTTYSFAHKSTQERLAAHYITEEMLKANNPCLTDLGVTDETCPSLYEVLLCVVQLLHDEDSIKFSQHWQELKDALRHADVTTFGAVRDCVRRCPDVPQMAELAALTDLTQAWVVMAGG